jgi:5-deoxy-glucuronate isomerase
MREGGPGTVDSDVGWGAEANGIFRRGPETLGYEPVLTPDNGPLRELEVGRIRLEAEHGGYTGATGDREALLHVLVGECTIEVDGDWGHSSHERLGERRDVFSGLPTSVLVRPGCTYTITATSRTADLALASLPVEAPSAEPVVIRPQDVREHLIGEGYYERTVREVIGGDGPAQRIRAGETINPVGRWSSWPHHDFDANRDNAPLFEEVFLYFTKPREGWGIQRRTGLFSDLAAIDDVFVFRNGDAAVLPLGDHPVVAGVQSEILYVWFYVSPIPKTYAKWAEDVGGYA